MIKIYMPFDSVATGTVIAHWCKADEMAMTVDFNLKVMEPYYKVTQMTEIRFVLQDIYELDNIERHAEQHGITLELRLHSHEDYTYDNMRPLSKVPLDAWEDMWKGLKMTSPREMGKAMREADARVKRIRQEEAEKRTKAETIEEPERRTEPQLLDELQRRVPDFGERVPFGSATMWDYLPQHKGRRLRASPH
jgi:hypothetical protein